MLGTPASVMTSSFLPIDAPLSSYESQAREHKTLAYPLTIDEARLAVARGYSFADWSALVQTVQDVQQRGSAVREFELAAEAVIDGDADTLTRMLRDNPQLVHARSERITCHEPAAHRATLLHYIAANGIENYRQRSPKNAVDIARLLLDAGAEVDALAGLYGGECACLSLLVSSSPPADAGVQVPLVHVLADYGANVNGAGASAWRSPLNTALVFGFQDAARALVQRGARVDSMALAAGLGDIDACRARFSAATADDRHRALALAVENDQLDVVRLLLEHGERADRFNPDGMHAHQTPLHSAALRGNLALVQLLLEYGASLTIEDPLWHATPIDWAAHGGQLQVVEFLRTR
jgi:ankyrin repeat protein